MMLKGSADNDQRKSSRRNRVSLKVDTKAPEARYESGTPRTEVSTPHTPTALRSSGDLRSPGAKMSPVAAPVPDFMTQTDRYGNATTPRPPPQDPAKQEHDADPCEALLDSIRLMCCCLVPEDSIANVTNNGASHTTVPTKGTMSSETEYITQVTTQLTAKDKMDDSIRLLPPLHADDTGKKCLVLDLDETLVHSSFRAVPGADFVIPVQVRSILCICA
jgi:hypothetical protein